MEFDDRYRAIETRNARFDGWFYVAVETSGIYCRPSCPVRTPKREHVRFFTTAAAAQGAGFRACKRCRPDASPGSPEWEARGDLVGRLMRLIADGVVEREGVAGLGRRVGFSERHVHRRLVEAVGAGPLALARAQRVQAARILLETTEAKIAQVAFAAGFASTCELGATIQEVLATSPGELRRRARPAGAVGGGAIRLRLPCRAPFDGEGLLVFLAARAIPGVEEVVDGAYRRSLRLPHGAGVAELRPEARHVEATFRLDDLRDLGPAIQRCRRLLDLDADPAGIAERLGSDPLIGGLVRAEPGRRVPGHVDGAELAARAVLGQQISLGGARTLAGGLVARHGEPLAHRLGTVTHLFPHAGALAEADLGNEGLPGSRRGAVRALSAALADGEIDLEAGAERSEARRRLLALPGIGDWTVSYIAMRALRDPDAFMPTDLGIRRALERLGHDGSPTAAARLAERWRPYRAAASQHLWSLLTKPASRDVEPAI